MSLWWWLERRAYFKIVVRELTSLFVGAFAVVTLLQIRAVGDGPEPYAAFAAMLGSPAFITFSVVAFLAVLFHALTWFPLVPTTIVLRVGEQRVPGNIIAGAHFAGWLIVSVVVAYILLRG
ncbi:MAG: fumarate reductase subunit C [Acidobacteria bacterium]|nr:fumarate reductase subunit C [Acidobacteriota bacterium]